MEKRNNVLFPGGDMSKLRQWRFLLTFVCLSICNYRCFAFPRLFECDITYQCCPGHNKQCDLLVFVFGFFTSAESKAKVHRTNERDKTETSNAANIVYSDFKVWLKSLQQDYITIFPIDQERGNYVRSVNNALFSLVNPTPFTTQLKLVAVSQDVLTKCLDLKPEATNSSQFIDFVSGNKQSGLFPPSLAHRYGGHQFGYWAGQLGDGRAHMMGIFTNKHGDRWELQLKGSGTTPYSRRGDGRAVLRSSVREFLASEAMHYLGIPTSRALSLIVSDDKVIRDQFYDGHPVAERGAIVLRLAPSWFRIGSLEILTRNGEHALLKSLLDYVIKMHFKHINVDDKDKYLLLFRDIIRQTAKMIAMWQSIGFTHGVCNTDNFSLLSITIDYGPFGFMEEYNPAFVPNTSDDEGRYSYQNQPDIGFYNLEKLRLALEPILDRSEIDASRVILQGYATEYQQQFLEIFRNKLGLTSIRETDDSFVALFLKIMQEVKADFTMSFRQLGEISLKQLLEGNIGKDLWALRALTKHKLFKQFLSSYKSRLNHDGVSETARKAKMAKYNPVYVLRNWMAEIAINKAENNDFSEVQKLYRLLKEPFTRQTEAEKAGFASKPPSWASHIKVSCSS